MKKCMYYLDYELKLQFVMSALLENFKVHIHAKTKSESSAVNITDFIHFLCIMSMYVHCTISKQPVILLDK